MKNTLESFYQEFRNLMEYDSKISSEIELLQEDGWVFHLYDDALPEKVGAYCSIMATNEENEEQFTFDFDNDYIEEQAENLIRSGEIPSLSNIARHAIDILFDEIEFS